MGNTETDDTCSNTQVLHWQMPIEAGLSLHKTGSLLLSLHAITIRPAIKVVDRPGWLHNNGLLNT